MHPGESDKRIDRICALLSALALWALAVMVNLFPSQPAGDAAGPLSTGLTPALAPEFRTHLLGLNLWLGLAVCLQLGLLLGERITIPQGLRLALDLFGAYTVGRIIVGGPVCVTPEATLVAKVLMMGVLFILLLSASDRLAVMMRGRDPFAHQRGSDGLAGSENRSAGA